MAAMTRRGAPVEQVRRMVRSGHRVTIQGDKPY